MVLISPLVLLRRQKYAAGFRERLGNYPEFSHDGRKVIWLHCVSVGETNAARPLVDELLKNFPEHRVVISTTTRTGQELAKNIFKDRADAVSYFPFDWKFSVRRALSHFRPALILLMETEIWPRLIQEAKRSGAKIAIVNGRLSERSFRRYSLVESFVRLVLQNVDLALMQGEIDAERIMKLGVAPGKVTVTGNIKFDLSPAAGESVLTDKFRQRFGIDGSRLLIAAASTHEPEERLVIESLKGTIGREVRLLVAPRHPERFDSVVKLIEASAYSFVRQSDVPKPEDRFADVILLDSIGELRAVYPLADIVFVGGSLIPHGGQNILEPAAAGRAIVTGRHTFNFAGAVKTFLEYKGLVQLPDLNNEDEIVARLSLTFDTLLRDPAERDLLGANALTVIKRNRGAVDAMVGNLKTLIDGEKIVAVPDVEP